MQVALLFGESLLTVLRELNLGLLMDWVRWIKGIFIDIVLFLAAPDAV